MFINVADIIDRNDVARRTYRQINNELSHSIKLGTLVEVIASNCASTGCRMFVVYCGRDCDGTPLYWLSGERDTEDRGIFNKWFGGYSDDALKVID